MPLFGVYSETLPLVDLSVYGLTDKVGVVTKYTANYIIGALYVLEAPILDVQLGVRDNLVIISNGATLGDTVWIQYAY